jgi:uncharacterized protein
VTPGRIRKSELPRDPLGRLRPPGAPDALAHLRTLDERLGSPEEALRAAAALFDEQRFFEAFRHLSWPLARTRGADEPHWWKGLAQVAAGFCHVQRGNAVGAERLLERALGYLEPYEDGRHGVRLSALRGEVRRVLHELRAGADPSEVGLPGWP